jgi:hypothetical protein
MPLGKPVLVGGMSFAAPEGTKGDAKDRQLYLVIDVQPTD